MAAEDLHYDWDAENEKAQRVLGMAREHLGDEAGNAVKEINAAGTIEEVAIRIRAEIDPFFVRVDNPDDVRDHGEGEAPLPKGDFGDYCPVTYLNDGWLSRGGAELEATVYGKSYLFAGEKELEEFKFNPAKYLPGHGGPTSLPLAPPPPKIMFLGMKGSGVTTQIKMLAEKYKLEQLGLRDAFLAKAATEREARKRRRLLDRGFKPPLPAEDGDGEEGAGGPPPDPEIEDDPEDFDNTVELLRMVTDASKGVVVDGTWQGGWPEQLRGADGTVVQAAYTPPESKDDGEKYCGLLCDARRPPEIVIMLRCSEPSAFERMIDAAAIKREYDRLMKEREDKRTK